ncbi:MAG: helix-turn-helix domain-containing protein [Christensenellaceae bacterium]|jgi:transposase-like protein|nr:helix-turn-helix domain-containing protein [Christensenellaceae bacterium]
MGTHGSQHRDFKFKIVSLHENEKKSVRTLAEEYSIPQQTIYSWCKQYRSFGEDSFVGCGNRRQQDNELQRLRKENEELKARVALLEKGRKARA